MVAATVLDEIRLYLDGRADRPWQPRQVPSGAAAPVPLKPPALPGGLLPPGTWPRKHPAELSPGELRRVALARGLARIEAGATVLLLDEPTAHLDRESATLVSRAIAGLRGQVTVLLVAHDRQTRELADHLVPVVGPTASHVPRSRTGRRPQPVDRPRRTGPVPAAAAPAGAGRPAGASSAEPGSRRHVAGGSSRAPSAHPPRLPGRLLGARRGPVRRRRQWWGRWRRCSPSPWPGSPAG